MKDIRCMFGCHKFSEWIEVGRHLERECPRCGEVEAKYPDPILMLVGLVGKVWLKQLEMKQNYPAFPIRRRR